MIYVTMTTCNRFWHSALTAISLSQCHFGGCFVHVLDDATDDDFSDAKQYMFERMALDRKIHRYERLPSRVGFCEGRRLLWDRFLEQGRFTHWFHLDDDILIGPRVVSQSHSDLKTKLDNKGFLHVYVNPWIDGHYKHASGEFAYTPRMGGASFIVSRDVLETIKNPYADHRDGEKANATLWSRLKQQNHPMYFKLTNPYPCQHTGNVQSTIFGKTPNWESLYAKDFNTGKILEVPGFPMNELRFAVKSCKLAPYAWRVNSNIKHPVKLPSPGAETGINRVNRGRRIST